MFERVARKRSMKLMRYVSPVPEGFQAPEITHKIIDRLRTVNLPVKGVPRTPAVALASYLGE